MEQIIANLLVADNAVIQKVRYSQMFLFFFFLISVTVASGFFFSCMNTRRCDCIFFSSNLRR